MKYFISKLVLIRFYCMIFLVITSHSFAVDGVLDPSFNGTGTLLIDITAPEAILSLAMQNNGRTVGVGYANGDWAIIRLNQDGTLDTSFNATGIVLQDLGTLSDTARDVKIQADQKIVVTGSSGSDASLVIATARYNTDGSLDVTFGGTGIVITDITVGGNGDTSSGLVIQPDGKIVVVGSANSSIVVVRYNVNGSLDTTFGTGGFVITTPSGSTSSSASKVVLQPDGKIVLCGSAVISGTREFLVARYNTDGSLDTTFGTNGIVTQNLTTDAIARGIVLQSDNKIVVGGSSGANFVLVRYDTNGSLDATFGVGGIVTTVIDTFMVPGNIAIQNDQKIIFAGSSGASTSVSAYTLIRYNTDGSFDTTFGTAQSGIVTTNINAPDDARTITLQSNGKIVVAGGSGGGSATNDFSFARYIGDGPKYAVEWGNLDVGLNSNIELRDTAITFTGECSLDGRNHLLILKDKSQIITGPDSNLLLENITILTEREDALQGINSNSTFLLDNVTLLLHSDLLFPFGKFSVVRNFNIAGEGFEFAYQTSATSTIEPLGKMILSRDVTLSYDPQSAQRNLVQLVDGTSQLILNGATLHATDTGWQLTRGQLFVDQKSFIASDSPTPASGIMFGNGIDENENLKVTIAPAATLEVVKGYLVFADA